jgi:hypothetical protein
LFCQELVSRHLPVAEYLWRQSNWRTIMSGGLKRAAILALLTAVLFAMSGCVYPPGYYQRTGVTYDDGNVASGPGYADYDDDYPGYGPGYYAPGYYSGPYGYGWGYDYGYPWLGFGFSGIYYSRGGHYWHGGGWHGGHGGWHGGGHTGGSSGGGHSHH